MRKQNRPVSKKKQKNGGDTFYLAMDVAMRTISKAWLQRKSPLLDWLRKPRAVR